MTKISRLPEVLERTGNKRSTWFNMIRRGEAPAPIKISERLNGWYDHEIDAWIEARRAQRESV